MSIEPHGLARRHHVIVIGGSAGALQSLLKIVRGLPVGFPAAIFVAIHTAPDNPGRLSTVLDQKPLPAVTATDGLRIQPGHIYVAPPDHHLLIKNGHIRVTRGPRENGFRPAVDPLFRTAAAAYGPSVIAVILSGGGDDGLLGLSHVKRGGGIVIAQDPTEADSPSMPWHAIKQIDVDHTLRADDMAAIISGLVRERVDEGAGTAAVDDPRPDQAEAGTDALDTGTLPGPPTAYRCPECGGALWELRDGKLLHFQCYVGHAFSPESLASAHADSLDEALWTALRALEESSSLRRRMAEHARLRGMSGIADSYEDHARDSEARATVLRRFITDPADAKAESS